MTQPLLVLAVNPGATSTKLALFEAESEMGGALELRESRTLRHDDAELAPFARVADQAGLRTDAVRDFLREAHVAAGELAAVVARGGLLRPLASGTYRVDEAMRAELRAAERGEHASNLGALIAHALAEPEGIPAYIVDPVCVDELAPVARVSGLAGIERESLSHALNTKAVARRFAAAEGRPYDTLRLVVAHLGTGISVSAHREGRMVDVTNPRDEGPLSPDRPGNLPNGALVDRCFRSGARRDEVRRELLGQGGLFSYLGTRDLRQAMELRRKGDATAAVTLDAMIYQIGKAVAEMASVLVGQLDAILLTGGMAHEPFVVEGVEDRVGWIAPVHVFPGEDELSALAEGALRVMRGEEPDHAYGTDAVEQSEPILI